METHNLKQGHSRKAIHYKRITVIDGVAAVENDGKHAVVKTTRKLNPQAEVFVVALVPNTLVQLDD